MHLNEDIEEKEENTTERSITNGTARWQVLGLETIRVAAKKSINKFAAIASVDRDTISKIEKKQLVNRITAQKVFDAMNKVSDKPLNAIEHIKEINNG